MNRFTVECHESPYLLTVQYTTIVDYKCTLIKDDQYETGLAAVFLKNENILCQMEYWQVIRMMIFSAKILCHSYKYERIRRKDNQQTECGTKGVGSEQLHVSESSTVPLKDSYIFVHPRS